jgi:hypothetical protein
MDKKKFGKGNLGYEGILMFFLSHTCNEYCRFLGLVHPKNVEILPSDFALFKNPPEPSDPNKQV